MNQSPPPSLSSTGTIRLSPGSAEDAEAGEGEASAQSEVPEASAGEQPEARSDGPAADTTEEADDEAADGAGEIAEAPEAGHNWWPIVLLMLCGAVLVTLGLFGTDRRRTR